MTDLFKQIRRDYYTSTLIEWLFWMAGTFLVVLAIKWFSAQYGAPEYEFHFWVTATLYLWYVSTISLIIGSTYFIARSAQTHLQRRQAHPQKPAEIDLQNDLERVIKIKKRAAIIAVVAHLVNACLVYFVTGHIPDITSEYQLYAVIGVFAIAAIKPAMLAVNSIRLEIFGMMQEADYPEKSVADLWQVVNQFGDYEKRLEKTFERLEENKTSNLQSIDESVENMVKQLGAYKEELTEAFEQQVNQFKASDSIREQSYQELQSAQAPLTKEVGKILSEIQTLKQFVIELRDKNIKGEQLMSALKEFGIDSLADLNVSFQKNIVNLNPPLASVPETVYRKKPVTQED